MTKIIKIAIILFQIGLTIGTTVVLYMLFAMFDYQGGFSNLIGLSLFQPMLAALVSILTVIVCGLVGLPIRLYKRLNVWWRTHFYVPILLALAGLISCAISLNPMFVTEIIYRMDGMDMTQTLPNQVLSISGWFLLAIATLHMYPPKDFKTKSRTCLIEIHGI